MIFQAADFIPPLGAVIDGDECVAAVLFWLCLQPGDVEEGYFAGYTPTQSEWLESGRAEELAVILAELEQHERNA
ncbi:hypothetical protein [Tautonia plasticadhaerens]|uniref:Uncharacterized protein n=1 Tax=Tautonia plasticadhaerens TaxID=2527974 RepID=A0A518H3E2_9BACT|nr:hypothetical protein [Tautonia plasticadhaerens]QDV35354.1 hypothetical protein ElP_32570 [Tautonia plasticadhaerens]